MMAVATSCLYPTLYSILGASVCICVLGIDPAFHLVDEENFSFGQRCSETMVELAETCWRHGRYCLFGRNGGQGIGSQ